MFVTGVCFQSPFPSTLLPLSWVPASHREAVRCQSPPVSPCPAAACDGGAEGLMLSEEGCVCVCVFQYSSQPLRFLPWCRASETSWPAAHFLLTAQTHTAGVLASRGALRGWPRSKPPVGRGGTHQLHLGTQSFQDPVGSLCLLLQGGKGKRGGERERREGGEKLFLLLLTATALCSSAPPVPKPLPKQIPAGNGQRQLELPQHTTGSFPAPQETPPKLPQNPSSPCSPGLLQLWSC